MVQYHPTATTLGQTVARCTLSTEGGRYGNEEEITHFLQKIAVAGRGRFHSYKGPGIQEITSLCMCACVCVCVCVCMCVHACVCVCVCGGGGGGGGVFVNHM